MKVHEPGPNEVVNRQTFTCTFDRAAWKTAMERDGCYILRACVPRNDWPVEDEAFPETEKQACILWKWYTQLV